MDGQILELGFQQWYREGREEGFEEGRKAERNNTLREKKRADNAEARVKDLEAQLAEKNNS